MNSSQENALGNTASAYLRSARHQPVAWQPWGTEAFAQAQREDKPVLLDIGAVWCHWCHVMDRESYENAETAAVINEHFIAVKVDRDERPDVDTRYQAAVSSISGQGGWPLTAFLTPEGLPFFGGTYFPPEERYGRPSFRRVLLTMADAFHARRAEVEESAGSVLEAIEQSETLSAQGAAPEGDAGRALLSKLIDSAVLQFDARNGGFGSQPKFPHYGVIDLLLDAAGRPGKHAVQAGQKACITLEKMAAGGICDQLGGGFHRYSVDERWGVPHFEKMAYDNSELLKNYAHAFQYSGEPKFAEVAGDILRWMDEWLSDREQGGFYASQDADESLDDDGDYFTWTEAEAEQVLTAEEFRAAKLYFGLRPVGDMHHNPAKNVLERKLSVSELAEALGRSESEALATLLSAKTKMYAARLGRAAPYIDRTVYTNWNGMCISAYLIAGRALKRKDVVEFALRSLDRVLAGAWPARGTTLRHVVAYSDGPKSTEDVPPVPGGLDDYAFLAQAALDAWESSGEMRYFAAAKELGDALLEDFYDEMGGGFFDTAREGPGAAPIGPLRTRRKPLQDAPTPAGNAVAATVMLRLAWLTDEDKYGSRGRETLEAFSGVVEHFGLYAASYGLALRLTLEGPVQVCILGDDALAEELAAAAEQGFAVGRSVIRLRRDQLAALPPVQAGTLPYLPAEGGSLGVICRGNRCLPPVRSVEELRKAMDSEHPAA